MIAEEILSKIENDEELLENFTEAFITDVASQIELLDPVCDAKEIITLVRTAITEGGDAHDSLSFFLGVSEVSDWVLELEDDG